MLLKRLFRQGICCLILFALAVTLGGCRRISPGELLRQVAGAGDATEVNKLLTNNSGIVDSPDLSTGMTPLEWAVIADHQAIVTTLLAHGANINAYDKLGMNPLAHAVRKNNWSMVQLLLERGARIHDVWFTKYRVTPLMIAATLDDKSMAEHLLALGVDRNARDNGGMTAGDYARSNGHLELMALLANPATTQLHQ